MAEARAVRHAIAVEMHPSWNYGHSLDIQLKGDEIASIVTLTMIYRAIPGPGPEDSASPSSFCAECIEAARSVMDKHQECVKSTASILRLQVEYIHWYVCTLSRSLMASHGLEWNEKTVVDPQLTSQVHSPHSICPLFCTLLPHHRDVFVTGSGQDPSLYRLARAWERALGTG